MKKGIDNQPMSHVEWVHRDNLFANNYNPNKVAPPEWALLRTSLLEDGWSAPIITRPDGEIVDGFHRWTLSGEPDVYAMTDGFVPIVKLPEATDRAHQIASTIRYSRARGNHYVVSMADIVAELKTQLGLTDTEIMRRLGMEDEEVERLADRGNMRKRGSAPEFNNGWVPDGGTKK